MTHPYSPRALSLVAAIALGGGGPLLLPAAAWAQEESAARHYDIPAGPLGTALGEFAAQAGILLSADANLTENKRSPGLRGRYTVREGLTRLLEDSGLTARFVEENTVALAPAAPTQLAPLTVIGATENA
ncbi:MAG: STN domain-containing protein [Ectothiorhodospiraceae bacterium]|nr:STN domain-containing protein [Ectothiorhodospiraceae bacterium]